MSVYVTLDREVLDLSGLSTQQREFFDRCYQLWKEPSNGNYTRVRALIFGNENPILEPGRRVTRAVAEQPLFKAVQDLEFRIGIIEGKVGPEDSDQPEVDPLGEEFVSIAQAADLKGVTVPAVHRAIERGDLVAVMAMRPAKVSRTSLDHWQVNATRQRARTKSA